MSQARRDPLGLVLAIALAALPILHLAFSTASALPDWRSGFDAAFTRWSYYAVPWVLGAATCAAGVAFRRPVHQAFGLGLMAVPLWETVWGILDSLVELFQGGFVFRAFTRHELSSLYLYKFLEDLGYLFGGFLLYSSDGGLRSILRQTPRALASRLKAVGLPLGSRGEGASALLGLVVFPVLLVSTIVTNLLLSGVEELTQSNESSIYDNMTLYHAVLISLAAGFGEELLYRGLLMTALSRKMPMVAAVLVQALVFGLAHGGYGTWIHVILPALFGLVAGLVAWRFGLWAAIALHVLVDLFAFGADASSNVPGLWDAIVWAFFANCVLTLAAAGLWVVRRVEARRAAPPG